MSSGAKRRQTLAKMSRERAVKERRALKADRKAQRKQARAEGATESPSAESPDES